MIRLSQTLTVFIVMAFASMAAAGPQDKPAGIPPPKPVAVPSVPLRIQVVISRFQGEKKISSLPYTMAINSTDAGDKAGHANIRMGTKVPVPSASFAPTTPGGAGTIPMMSYNYQDVGTNIDCFVHPMDDGRFRVDLTIDDSSVYPEEKEGTAKLPSFRSFRAGDSMILKDGGTAQFTTAADKVSGEIVKVDVTLTVVK